MNSGRISSRPLKAAKMLPSPTSSNPLYMGVMGCNGQRVTELCKADGRVNGTMMCQMQGLRFIDYLNSAGVQEFLANTAAREGMFVGAVFKAWLPGRPMEYSRTKAQKPPDRKLIVGIRVPNHTGSMVHPKVALHLVDWCKIKLYGTTRSVFDRYIRAWRAG